MTVRFFEVEERMRGETEEYIALLLSGETTWIQVGVWLDGRLKEILFQMKSGSVDFTPTEVVYRFSAEIANYTFKIEATGGTLEPMLSQFEDVLIPYLPELKAKQLTQEEADKLYDELIEALKDNLKADLMFVVKDLFGEEFDISSFGEEVESDG